MKKGMIIATILFIFIISFVIFWIYMGFNWGISERDSYKVVASNGDKFKAEYVLYTMPDPSCRISLKYKGDSAYVEARGEYTSKKIEMDYLYEKSGYKYYSVRHMDDISIVVLNDDKKMKIISEGSYIESMHEEILLRFEYIEEYAPLAEYYILNNIGDYIIPYADRLIEEGNDKILNKLQYFTSNPEKIATKIYTRDEILLKCNELLKKYGGEQ